MSINNPIVNSVAGKDGDVTLVKGDVGLNLVDNTSDLSKPISTLTQTALNGKANLAGGNVFTGNQIMGTALVNIPQVPLNLVNSAAGTLRTQLNLVNGGGGGGAGSAIDFHTYDDQPTTSGPGARIGAVDDNFSAYLAFYTKTPGGPANAILERMRITNNGSVGVGGTPLTSAKFQIDSTTQGFLMPRMTSAQRDAIATPAQGLQVYDTTLKTICTFDGSVWIFQIAQVVQNNQGTTSTTYGNVTELVTPTLPAGRYVIEFAGAFQSTATTTGVGIRLNGSTISTINAKWNISQAADGTDSDFQYSQLANTTNIVSTGVLTANTDFPVTGFGVFSLSAPGTVAAQLRTEVAGSTVSIRINSALIIRRITG